MKSLFLSLSLPSLILTSPPLAAGRGAASRYLAGIRNRGIDPRRLPLPLCSGRVSSTPCTGQIHLSVAGRSPHPSFCRRPPPLWCTVASQPPIYRHPPLLCFCPFPLLCLVFARCRCVVLRQPHHSRPLGDLCAGLAFACGREQWQSSQALSCIFEPDVCGGWASILTGVALSAGEQLGVQERQPSLDRWVLCPRSVQQRSVAFDFLLF